MRLRWRTGATPHGDNGNGNGQMDLATLPGTPPESRDLMSKTRAKIIVGCPATMHITHTRERKLGPGSWVCTVL